MKTIKIKLLNNDAQYPKKATDQAAGYDLCSCETLILKKNSFQMISTGISLEMENGLEAQVRPRSGLAAKHGVTVLNSPGTIDSDYRGEIKVILINHSQEDFTIEKGMRIAQLVFAEIISVNLEEVKELNTTARSAGGFGSTGYH